MIEGTHKKGDQIGDVFSRPYAGYECWVCGGPVVWRPRFQHDECMACAEQMNGTTAPLEWIQATLDG